MVMYSSFAYRYVSGVVSILKLPCKDIEQLVIQMHGFSYFQRTVLVAVVASIHKLSC